MPCPVCRSALPIRLLQRRATPVLQNAVFQTAESARDCPTGELSIELCRVCGFVWNSAFDVALFKYSAAYDNSQLASEAFSAHVQSRIARVAAAIPAEGALSIVEIGCGQGDFLQRLLAALPASRKLRAVGFDPAFRARPSSLVGRMEFHAEYFDESTAGRLDVTPDILICRHTIEHVPDPVAFLKAIRKTIPEGKPTRLFLETPDSGWILRNRAFQDFFYEHCSLFDFGSMSHALRDVGFVPVLIEACFGGQYLWAEAVSRGDEAESAQSFGAAMHKLAEQWKALLRVARKEGPIAVWGAGAKGATFALLADPDASLVSVVVDVNPAKQGGFLAMTAHPIVAPERMAEHAIRSVVIMNPVYTEEIKSHMVRLGSTARVLVLQDGTSLAQAADRAE